ncbi:MAG: recombinase family protein [Candidatus Binatia bacterium]|jgi:DNA invertase Pin-like site-specific DNA recombinase
MNLQRPREVKASHLARRAKVYIRQSTEIQVKENRGSTDYQRSQASYPREWGWPDEAIEVIEDDLGLSGATTVNRSGYLRMVGEVRAGLVGAIFVSDLSRLGRDAEEWFALLNLCVNHDVLIVADGKVHNFQDRGDLLLARIGAVMAEHDNLTRRETLERGRIAKASKGHTVSQPPAGYVREKKEGQWLLDPEARVRTTVQAVFAQFFKQRSLNRTVVALNRLGIQLPRRTRCGALRWIRPNTGLLQHMLKNPSYRGEYHYGRLRIDRARGRTPMGRWRIRRAAVEEVIVVRNHHDAYVTPTQWDEIQSILKLNGPSEVRRNLGPGSALLQGIVRCALHRDRAMASVYQRQRRDGGRNHSYYCQGDYWVGGPQCGRIPGLPLDRAVVQAILERLSVPRLETIREEWRRARADERTEQHRCQLELNRARQAASDLEYRYMSVDPANRLVAAGLETKLEQAQRDLKRLEKAAESGTSPMAIFDENAFAELVALCRDLSPLWHAASTLNPDRKQIIRSVVSVVKVEGRTLEKIYLRIVWADRVPDTRIEVALNRHAHQIARRLSAEGIQPAEIACQLNGMGILTKHDRPWTEQSIGQVLWRMKKKTQMQREEPDTTPQQSATTDDKDKGRTVGGGAGDKSVRLLTDRANSPPNCF